MWRPELNQEALVLLLAPQGASDYKDYFQCGDRRDILDFVTVLVHEFESQGSSCSLSKL